MSFDCDCDLDLVPEIPPPDKRVQEILEEIEGLPEDRKAKLLEKLLGRELGMNVIFGNGGHDNHVMQADVVIQLNGVPADVLKTLVDAIASRIEK